MEMTKKNLNAILSSVRGTMGVIECLAYENYPYEITEDQDIQKMYYCLNDICVMLFRKFDAAEN